MKIKYLSIIALGLAFFAVSCKKEKANGPSNKDITDKPADIYVAGEVKATRPVAAFWKNNALTILGDTAGMSFASGIAVQGSDVYVLGTVFPAGGGSSYNVVWKNGVATKLNGSNQDAFGIAVSGNDVYVVGSSLDDNNISRATYWKNNVLTILPNGFIAEAIAINGTDVYITGTTKNDATGQSVYWKNGTQVVLPGGFWAKSIAISGNDIYVGGQTLNGAAIYWKNGAYTQFGTGATGPQPGNGIVPGESDIQDIAANGTDVYAVGMAPDGANGTSAVYWKGTSEATLVAPSSIEDNPQRNYANGISLYGSDVYILSTVGNATTQQSESYVWKNGVATKLHGNGSDYSIASRIIAVPQP
jgi:hypothetical protein